MLFLFFKSVFVTAVFISFVFCTCSLANGLISSNPKAKEEDSVKEYHLTTHKEVAASGLDRADIFRPVSQNPRSHDLQEVISSPCAHGGKIGYYIPHEADILKLNSYISMDICQPNNLTIVSSANIVKNFIDDFKDSYTQTYYLESWDITNAFIFPNSNEDYFSLQICDMEQLCFWVLPQLPSSHQPPATQEELEALLIQLLGFAQQYVTAFETLFLDQSLREEAFKDQMFDSIRNLEELVATLLDSVTTCGLLPNEELIKNLTGKTYVDESDDFKHERGFRALRQCLFGMQFIYDVLPIAV